MRRWMGRLVAALLRPPVTRPMTDAERKAIREAYEAKRAATQPAVRPPLADLPWDEWMRRSAGRQAGAGR